MPKILHYSINHYAPTLTPLTMTFTQYLANIQTYQFCKDLPSYGMSSFSLKNTLHIQKTSKLRVKTTSESSKKSKVALSTVELPTRIYHQNISSPCQFRLIALQSEPFHPFRDLPHATSKYWKRPQESIPRAKIVGTCLFVNTHRPTYRASIVHLSPFLRQNRRKLTKIT